MKLSDHLLRIVAAFALLCLATTSLAQSTPAEPSISASMLQSLRDSQKEASRITLVTTGGVKIRGVVTDIQPEFVSLTVKYGEPSVHLAYREIDHMDRPPLTHRRKVTLGVLIGASVAGIVVLITAMIKHA